MTLYVLIPLLSIIILGGITVFRMIWLLKKGGKRIKWIVRQHL